MLDLFSMDSEIIVVDKNKSRSRHIVFYINRLDKFLKAEYNQSCRALECFERGIKLDVGLLNLLLVSIWFAELFVKFFVERQAQKV